MWVYTGVFSPGEYIFFKDSVEELIISRMGITGNCKELQMVGRAQGKTYSKGCLKGCLNAESTPALPISTFYMKKNTRKKKKQKETKLYPLHSLSNGLLISNNWTHSQPIHCPTGFCERDINNTSAGTRQPLRHWPKHRMAGEMTELTNCTKRKDWGHCANQEESL